MDLKCYAHIIYTDHPTDERRKRTTATKRWRLTPPGGQIFEMLMDVLTRLPATEFYQNVL